MSIAERRVAMWDAINEYVMACGGTPRDKRGVSDLVFAVESVVDDYARERAEHEERCCIVIPADGTKPMRMIPRQLAEREELEKIVGGPLESVTISKASCRKLELVFAVRVPHPMMYCNDVGRLVGAPPNARASNLVGDKHGIVGDVFVMQSLYRTKAGRRRVTRLGG